MTLRVDGTDDTGPLAAADGLPVTVLVNPSGVCADRFIAKAGLYYRTWRGDRTLMTGFACRSTEEAAATVATAELIEHLHATYDFNREAAGSEIGFPVVSWPGGEALRSASAGEVLLGPIAGEPQISNDASGLSLHRTFDRAAEHAAFELLERHCLCEIWYGSAAVVALSDPIALGGDYSVTMYGLAQARDLPFVVAVARAAGGQSWLCGSSLRAEQAGAVQHALDEITLLLDDLQRGNEGETSNLQTRMRILSLRDAAQSQVREQFWSTKTRDDKSTSAPVISQKTWTATAVLKRLLGEPCAGFEVAKIKDYRDEAALVRCLQPALRKMRTARNEKPANIPPDPFC